MRNFATQTRVPIAQQQSVPPYLLSRQQANYVAPCLSRDTTPVMSREYPLISRRLRHRRHSKQMRQATVHRRRSSNDQRTDRTRYISEQRRQEPPCSGVRPSTAIFITVKGNRHHDGLIWAPSACGFARWLFVRCRRSPTARRADRITWSSQTAAGVSYFISNDVCDSKLTKTRTHAHHNRPVDSH